MGQEEPASGQVAFLRSEEYTGAVGWCPVYLVWFGFSVGGSGQTWSGFGKWFMALDFLLCPLDSACCLLFAMVIIHVPPHSFSFCIVQRRWERHRRLL